MTESDESSELDVEESPEASSDADGDAAGHASEESAVDDRIDTLVAERDALREQVAALESEREELTSRLKRAAADFENYKKRQERRHEQREAAATERLIERLLDVRDNLKRALEQESEDIESLREGVKLTLAEFDRVLDAEDVVEIDPEPGTAVDPDRHEVIQRVDSTYPKGHIDEVYQPGYENDDKVLRPAQVTVSTGAAERDSAADAE